MRASVSSLSKRLLSTFFAATLVLGLVPVAAFADDASGSNDVESVDTSEGMAVEGADPGIDDADGSTPAADASASGEDVAGGDVATGDDANLGTPILAGDIINQEMALSTVAQAESTRSYFLAQTLESTKTVPVVSAKLPLDSGANQGSQAGADGGQIAVGSEDKVTDGDLPTASTEAGSGDEAEGGEDSDESDLGSGSIAADSIVMGSFIADAGVYALNAEEGTVSLTAVDATRLDPEDQGVLIIPSTVSPDPDAADPDYYYVSRIAPYALAASDVTVLVVPSSVEVIEDDAFAECPTLQRIEVSALNQSYSSYDGVVYGDADVKSLLLIPEGRQGAVRIAPTAEEVSPEVFSHCPSVEAIFVDTGSAAFSSRNGLLYDSEGTTLMAVPPALTDVVITGDVESIAEGAVSGCELSRIQVEKEEILSLFEGYAPEVTLVQVRPGDVLEAWYQVPEGTAAQPEDPRGLPYEVTVNDDYTVTMTKAPVSAGAAENGNDIFLEDTIVTLNEGTFHLRSIRPDSLALSGFRIAMVFAEPLDGDPIDADLSPWVVSMAGDADAWENAGFGASSLDLQLEPVAVFDLEGASENGLLLDGDGALILAKQESLYLEIGGDRSSGRVGLLRIEPFLILACYVEKMDGYAIAQFEESISYGAFATSSLQAAKWDTILGSGFSFYFDLENYGASQSYGAIGSGYVAACSPQGNYGAGWKDISTFTVGQTVNDTSTTTWDTAAGGYKLRGWKGTEYLRSPVLYCTSSQGFYLQFTNRNGTGITAGLTLNNVWQKCRLVAYASGYGFIFIAPPYTIGMTWNPMDGTFVKNGVTYSNTSPLIVDSGVTEDGVSSYSFSHPTDVKATDPKKVLYGWNTSSTATKDTTSGWWYKADGSVNVTSTKATTTLYAIYQDGFPLNWNVSKFGGSTAKLGDRITGTNNTFTASSTGGQEVVAISNSSNSTGTVRFPKQENLANGARFLGWTNNADGSAPSGGYFKYEDGIYTVSATGLSGPRTFSVTTSNSTWYAVWETDVTFAAASYGGKVLNGSSDSVTKTVYNNQALTPSSHITTATSGASTGAFVPVEYGNAGYTAANWQFAGWTSASGASSADTDKTAPGSVVLLSSFVPDGTTTYYGVWQCNVSWAAQSGIAGASIDPKAAAWYVYGSKVTVPGANTPSSHHFFEWRDTVTAAGSGIAGANGVTYTVRTGGPVTAYWAPNEGLVKLDSRGGTIDGTARDQQTYAKWGDALKTTVYDDAGNDTGSRLKAPVRTGYQFAGYWNHPYSENTASNGEFSGKIACYYVADGTTGDLKVADGVDAWNLVGDDIVLYAHWRYKVVLDLNVYDSDGNIVTSGSGYAASIEDSFAPATEQVEANITQISVPRNETDASYGTTTVSAYAFTAIDGAPIQLPKATGRSGYADISRWSFGGTTLRAGAALSDPFAGDPSSYDAGFLLKADWSDDPDGIDGGGAGSTTSYDVTYTAGEGATVTTGGPAATTIKYDGKMTVHPGPGSFAKTGYHFVGWKASTTADKLYAEGASEPYTHRYESAVVFTAQWEPNVYTVKLHGATAGAADEQTLYVRYGEGWFTDPSCTMPASSIASPVRSGYALAGFADGASATTPAFFTTMEDGKRVIDPSAFPSSTKYSDADTATVRDLHPVWRADVLWQNPSATAGAFTTTEYAYACNGSDASVAYRDQGSRAGYDKGGWQVRYGSGPSATYLKTDATIGAIADDEIPQLFSSGAIPVAGHCTVEATWTPVVYTMTFDLGSAKYPEEAASDFAVSAGSGFTGTTSNLPTVNQAADGSFKASSTFNATASSATLARPYEGASGTIVLPSFVCTGFGFEGWEAPAGVVLTERDGTCSLEISSDASSVLRDLTFVAKWGAAPESFALTTTVLMRDGASGLYGTPDASTDMFDGDLPTNYDVSGLALSNLAAKPGYVFEGWKAYKRSDPSASMLRQNGASVDNLDGSAAPARQDGASDKVSIAAGMTGDGNVILVAYFTKVRYGLSLRMSGIDDAEMKPADANWEKRTDDTGAVVYELKGGFTVDAATRGGIALPVFDRAGYAFGGWSGSASTGGALSDDKLTLLLQKSYASGRGLQDYVLDALWTPESYSIAYSFEHMLDVDHPHDADALGRYTFEGSATLGGDIEINPPVVDPAYYDSFDGWVVEDAGKELDLGGHGLSYSDAEKGWMLSFEAGSGTIVIDRDSLRDFFPGNATGLTLRATHTARAYTATLVLNGGAMPSGYDAQRWKALPDGTYQAVYTCDDEDIAIPEPWKYGCTFGGWTLTIDGVDGRVDHIDGTTTAAILHDSIGERIYSVPTSDDPNQPGWTGAKATVRFDANVSSGVVVDNVPGGVFEVTFDKLMPVGSGFAVPVREGYDFAGFFDTPAASGGKQYYNASFEAARTWDKDVQYYEPNDPEYVEGDANVKPYTLYARWSKSAPAGTPEPYVPKPAQIVYDPEAVPPAVIEDESSHLTIRSQVSDADATVCATPALDAFFNGAYTAAADGTVKVDVGSFVWKGTDPREVYEAFNAANGVEGKYLSGFLIVSTKDVIAFSDLAQGNSFVFTMKAADVEATLFDDGTVKTLSIAGGAVVALYSDTPYEFGGGGGGVPPVIEWPDLPVPSTGEVQVVFKGEGGTMVDEDGSETSNLLMVTRYAKTATSPDYLALDKPADPTRAGYVFAGWSLHPQADHRGDDCDCTLGELTVTDILKKTYYAHWKEATYRVVFDRNHDDVVSGVSDIVFGSTENLSTYVDDGFTERAGYLFLGYFDARSGGVQYFASSGAAVRAWDRTDTDPASVLYAHWMIDPASPDAPPLKPSEPDTPSPSVDDPPASAVPVDPYDPFPPKVPSIVIPTDENSTLRIPTTVGIMSLDGRYDGVYAESAQGDAAIMVSSYHAADVPGTYGSSELSLRAMIARFEASAAAGGQYLQGFRVLSTGSFVSVADLYYGNSFTITAKTDDLDRESASVAFKNNTVEPVYGPTSPIPPVGAGEGDWPVEPDPSVDPPVQATQVYNVFDARGGTFADGLRFAVCPSGYGELVSVPKDAAGATSIPVYAPDPTYHFDGWFTAAGVRVSDAEGALVDDARQWASTPVTYYARYVRTYYAFELYDSNDGVDAAHAGSEELVASFRPYNGESLSQMSAASGEFAGNLPPARDGYDFIGYFYRDEDGTEHPLYLSTAAAAKDHPDYTAFESARRALESHDGGWGELSGIAGSDVDKDLANTTTIELYAKWNAITYKVKWVYNWAGRGYDHIEDGVVAPTTETAKELSIRFGTKVGDDEGEMAIPVIHDPAYGFMGWYAGTDAQEKDFAVRLPVSYSQADKTDEEPASYAQDAASGYFVERDGARYFQPHGIENMADKWPRTIVFYAAFDLDVYESYKYRVYLGRTSTEAAHGEFKTASASGTDERGIPYYEATYRPAYGTDVSTHFSFAAPKTGYTGPFWYGSDDAEVPLALPVSIPAFTTGLQEFYLGWQAGSYALEFSTATLRLEGADELSSPDGTIRLLGGGQSAFSSDEFGQVRVVLPEPSGARGYAFVGWKKIDDSGAFVEGSKLYTGDIGAFDATFVSEHFGGAAGGVLAFGAVWAPSVYEVNFHTYPLDSAEVGTHVETYTLVSEDGVLTEASAPRDHKLVLPYPHTTNVGKPFDFWSLYENDGGSDCMTWKSGTELTLRDILTAMAKDRDLEAGYDEESGRYSIDIYANWLESEPVSVDVPIQVSFLIDPYRPHDVAVGKVMTSSVGQTEVGGRLANGWVSSMNANAIRIESLTFVRGADELFALDSGEDGGDAFTLRIYGGGLSEDAQADEALSLPMGEDTKSTVVLRDDATAGTTQGSAAQDGHIHGERLYLSDFGMGDAIGEGERLYLYYDLELDESLPDLTRYSYLMRVLLDAHEIGENGQPTSKRLSAALANLYYTVGLAS